MNPLIDLSKYNDEELLEKMNDLYSKMGSSSFIGNDILYSQLHNYYNLYAEEFNRRQTVAWEKQKAKFEQSLRVEKKPRIRRNHREK